MDDFRGKSRSNHDGVVGPTLASILVHIGDFQGVDSSVTPGLDFYDDVVRRVNLYVGIAPALNPVRGNPSRWGPKLCELVDLRCAMPNLVFDL